jgi:hypothetical protein
MIEITTRSSMSVKPSAEERRGRMESMGGDLPDQVAQPARIDDSILPPERHGSGWEKPSIMEGVEGQDASAFVSDKRRRRIVGDKRFLPIHCSSSGVRTPW